MNNKEPYQYGQKNPKQNDSGAAPEIGDLPREIGKLVYSAVDFGTAVIREVGREFSEHSGQNGQNPGQTDFKNQQYGEHTQQAENLRQSAQNLANTVMQEVSRGMDDLSGRIRSNNKYQESHTPTKNPTNAVPTNKAVPAYVNRPLKQPSKIKSAMSYLVACAATVGAVGFGFMVIEFISFMEISAAFTSGVLFLLSSAAAVHGFRTPGRTMRRFRYHKAIGTDKVIPLSRLAEASQCSVKRVKRDVSMMIRKNMLPDAYIDNEESILFLDAEQYRKFQRSQEAKQQPQEKPEPGEELVLHMEQFIQMLDECVDRNGQQTMLLERLAGLRRVMTDILSWVRNHPSGSSQVRKLTSYYMPTTLKLLRAYEDAKDQPGETAEGIRRDIIEALQNIKNGFENLRTSLLTDTALDVAAEIGAVQTMMVQDGMADPFFEFKE